MKGLLQELLKMKELQELMTHLQNRQGPALVTGVSPVQRAQLAAAAAQQLQRPLLMLCADEAECRRMAADLQVLLGVTPVVLPGREVQLRPIVAASRQWEYRRLAALYRMAQGSCPVVLASADAVVQRCIPPQILRDAAITLRIGEQHDIAALVQQLTRAGYSRCDVVEGVGQFAVRGGILAPESGKT